MEGKAERATGRRPELTLRWEEETVTWEAASVDGFALRRKDIERCVKGAHQVVDVVGSRAFARAAVRSSQRTLRAGPRELIGTCHVPLLGRAAVV
jgi:hypothetical protein